MDNSWRNIFVGRQTQQQALRDAFEKAKQGQPQVVTFIAETGWGKTRIVQHFYDILAQSQNPDNTYWPRELVDQSDYERARRRVVNPGTDSLGRRAELPEFLWVAMQGDERPEVNETGPFLRVLQPHLRPLLCARLESLTDAERKEALRELGIGAGMEVADAGVAIAEVLLAEIPVVKQIIAGGKILNVIRQYASTKKSLREQSEALDRQVGASPSEEAIRGQTDAEDECLAVLKHYFDAQIPVVIIADDAHWLNPEPVNVLRRVFDLAQHMEAPLVVIGTHWRSEWDHGPSTYAEWAQALHDHARFDLQKEPDLVAVVQAAFPNLNSEDAKNIVTQGEGQPLFVLQILQEALEHPNWFEADGTRLTELGRRQLNSTGTYGEFCQRRFNRLAADTKRLLGWGSVQGSTFLHRLTRAVGQTVGNLADHDDQVQAAYQKGVAVPRQAADGSRFDQFDFRRLAENFLIADGNQDQVVAAINAALIQEILGDVMETLPREERMDLARIAIKQLEPGNGGNEECAWQRAALDLALQECQDRNWSTAVPLLVQLALQIAKSGTSTCLEFWPQIEGCRVLVAHGKATEASQWLDRIVTTDRRQRSVLLNEIGNSSRVRGDLNGALTRYEECVLIFQELAQELGTPEARRDVSVSLDNVARILQARGDLNGALTRYEDSLEIRQELAQELGTVDSWRDVAVSLGLLAILKGPHDPTAACADLREARAINEQLVAKFPDIVQFVQDQQSLRVLWGQFGCEADA